MRGIALYFASGESLYLGAGLLAPVAVSSTFLKRKWLFGVSNAVTWVAVALMVMACPPFPLTTYLIFLAVFLVWFISSNQTSATRLHQVSALSLTVLLFVLTAIEFPHRRLPRIAGSASDHLVVIGDSISSGIESQLQAWPLVLQQTCGLEVRNLARPGAQVTDGVLMASGLADSDHVVLIEIGGNDL